MRLLLGCLLIASALFADVPPLMPVPVKIETSTGGLAIDGKFTVAGDPRLDAALTRLASLDPTRADLVKLRFFAGLTMPEAAAALGLSLATAERYWAFARAWLYAELTRGDEAD